MILDHLSGVATGPAPGLVVGWPPFTIEIGNLVVIVIMLVLFGLALTVPFIGSKAHR